MFNWICFVVGQVQWEQGNVIIIENGFYMVYINLVNLFDKLLFWCIWVEKIIYNQQEKVICFENVVFEVYGKLIVYLLYFLMFDFMVKWKFGFLILNWVINNKLGYGVMVFYYWVFSFYYDFMIIVILLMK